MRYRVRGSRAAFLLLVSGFLQVPSLLAQSPIGEPRPVSSENRLQRGFQEQTVLANGDVLVVWLESVHFEEGDPVAIRARRFGPHGPRSEVLTLEEGTIIANDVFAPRVAPRIDGGFLLLFGRHRENGGPDDNGCRAQAFDDRGVPLAPEAVVTSTGGCFEGLVALEDGSFGTVLYERRGFGREGTEFHLFERLSPVGERISRPRRLNPHPHRIDESLGWLAGNAQGEMTYVRDGSYPGQVRSFNAYGGPLPPLSMVRFTDSTRTAAVVTPSGQRIFAGLNRSLPDSNYPAYQVFSPTGTPLTRVRPAIAPRHALFGEPVLASDRLGNFVLAWASLPTIFDAPTEARLFRADGTPVGPSFFPGGGELAGFQPQVSFGQDGTFAITWVDYEDLKIAWFSASPDDGVVSGNLDGL